jgi:hypothetical protein
MWKLMRRVNRQGARGLRAERIVETVLAGLRPDR